VQCTSASLKSLAVRYSRFLRAIFVSLIPTGHSAAQAPVFVQLPKPSASIWSTMACARLYRSVWPCGRRAYCDILAETKSMAEEFLQAATQAPQAIHVADSNASSATTLGMGIAFASGTPPVFTLTYPPACWIRSNAVRSTAKSLDRKSVV